MGNIGEPTSDEPIMVPEEEQLPETERPVERPPARKPEPAPA